MQITRQQKILAAVLGLGLLALGVDRMVLDSSATSPQAAAAGMSMSPGYSASTSPQKLKTLSLAQTLSDAAEADQPATLADRLNTIAQQFDLTDQAQRDAFAPSEAWQATLAPTRQTPTAATEQTFRKQHRLMAVMTPGRRGLVVVNNQPMRVGQTLDGFTLVAIDRFTATFQGPQGQVTLQLDPTAR